MSARHSQPSKVDNMHAPISPLEVVQANPIPLAVQGELFEFEHVFSVVKTSDVKRKALPSVFCALLFVATGSTFKTCFSLVSGKFVDEAGETAEAGAVDEDEEPDPFLARHAVVMGSETKDANSPPKRSTRYKPLRVPIADFAFRVLVLIFCRDGKTSM